MTCPAAPSPSATSAAWESSRLRRVLNPPQVAILGVDSIQLKPVRREGRIEFIDAIGLSITFDHQVIDGAPGARFLKVVKEKIENVESLCTI